MKMLRNPTRIDILLDIFDEIGMRMTVEDLLRASGIKNYDSLKVLFGYIRKGDHIPQENRIDIRIRDGVCTRVK